MKQMTTAARQDAAALFLAAVHVVAPGLSGPPARLVAASPLPTGEHVWAWATSDPALAPIAGALDGRQAGRVRTILAGMVAQLRATG